MSDGAADGETWEEPSGTVTLFGVTCPLGSQCKKGGANLCKKKTEEEARQHLINHLMVSPYHGLAQLEAEAHADQQEISSWEDVTSYNKSKADEADWAASRRRRGGRGGGAAASADPMYRAAPYMPPLPAVLGGGSGSDGGITMVPLRADRVIMTKEELKNISDSLRRAKTACQAAHMLCAKASRAFGEECQVIAQCEDVVNSHLV